MLFEISEVRSSWLVFYRDLADLESSPAFEFTVMPWSTVPSVTLTRTHAATKKPGAPARLVLFSCAPLQAYFTSMPFSSTTGCEGIKTSYALADSLTDLSPHRRSPSKCRNVRAHSSVERHYFGNDTVHGPLVGYVREFLLE